MTGSEAVALLLGVGVGFAVGAVGGGVVMHTAWKRLARADRHVNRFGRRSSTRR